MRHAISGNEDRSSSLVRVTGGTVLFRNPITDR
jgi:hypothetical protein